MRAAGQGRLEAHRGRQAGVLCRRLVHRDQLAAGELPERGMTGLREPGDRLAHLLEKRGRFHARRDVAGHQRQRLQPTMLGGAEIVDDACVPECEHREQADLLEAVQLRRPERPVGLPAEDEHGSDGVPERQRHDRGVLHVGQRRGEGRFRPRTEPAPGHNRPGRDRLEQQRLPLQPGHLVLMTDEIGLAPALVARFDAKDVLIEAREGAPVDVEVLRGEPHQPPHDLMSVTAGDEVDLDGARKPGHLRVSGRVRAGRARCRCRRARGAGGCRGRRGAGGT